MFRKKKTAFKYISNERNKIEYSINWNSENSFQAWLYIVEQVTKATHNRSHPLPV